MSWEFMSSSNPVARKHYRCEWCKTPIEIGEKHHHYWGKFDGAIQDTRMHTDCFTAAQDLDDEELPMETIPRGMTYAQFDAQKVCEYCDKRYDPDLRDHSWVCPQCQSEIAAGEIDALRGAIPKGD